MDRPEADRDLPLWMYAFSPALVAVGVSALAAFLTVILWPPNSDDRAASMWIAAKPHYDVYEPLVEQWNSMSGTQDIEMQLLGRQVMSRRMLGGFLGNVPVAELIEAERSTASLAFAGPADTVGFLDLTERLRESGLLDRITPAAFSPWTYEGKIFGIPHDVHPVMLGYRVDMLEQAGISVDGIETWDDLFTRLRPLQADNDGDGVPDRYILGAWSSSSDTVNTLLLQAGGGPFLPDGTLAIRRDINAHAIATLVTWMGGENQVATDVPDFTPVGNKLKRDGAALCFIMPDWMCHVYKEQIPQLAGKLRLMPLPAWEEDGRRTSVWGGSMLGISKAAEDPNSLWHFATWLYTSDDLARQTYQQGDIITPIEDLWDDPIFDEPDDYFDGQAKGRLYIELADQVPLRPATPFFSHGQAALHRATATLHSWAEARDTWDYESLLPEAHRVLDDAHEDVERIMARNTFHREKAEAAP